MSLRHFGGFQKYFLEKRGDYFKKVDGDTTKFFDVKTIYILASDGSMLRFIGVKGMREDLIYFMGNDCTQFASLGFIKMYIDPDNNKFYKLRDDTNGYSYICDFVLYGDFILKRPAGCAVLYGVPNASTLMIT